MTSGQTPPNQTSGRFDCPTCGGRNTLSVLNDNGMFIYHCFRASCKVAGKVSSGTDVSSIVKRVTQPQVTSRVAPTKDIRETYWHSLQQLDIHLPAINWLKKYHCYEWAIENNDRVMYDPKYNRLVFLCKNEQGLYHAAASRKLNDKDYGPKWVKTGSIEEGFFANTLQPLPLGVEVEGKQLVLVEDAASACSVARITNSLSLLGTSLTAPQLEWLRNSDYNDIVICLDRDAINLAVGMHKELRSIGLNARVVFPKDDPKYLSIEELEELLND